MPTHRSTGLCSGCIGLWRWIMAAIDVGTVTKLTRALPGQVFTEADEKYQDALDSAVWNGAIRRRPGVIAQPRTTAEVVDVLSTCRRHSVDLTVRGGGHGFAGHVVADGAVMLDLRLLDQISVDVEAGRVRCGGGTTWAALDTATAEHGLAVPGGFISHTGVAGLTLGGGMGWLSRWGGLSCDNLLSVELVTADGRVVTASAEENPDLFWALRGGGGNFGVATTFEFAAHESSTRWPTSASSSGARRTRTLRCGLPATSSLTCRTSSVDSSLG